MDSTSVARQRIPLVVHKLSVPHCSPDCRPLLVLIRRPHCQSTPLPHLVHTIRTTHSSVCGNVAHHTGKCCTPHRGMLHATPGNVAHHTGECCTPHRGMLRTTPDWAVRWPPRLHLSSVPSHPARHQPQSSHDTGISIGPRAGRVLLFSMPIGRDTRRLHHRIANLLSLAKTAPHQSSHTGYTMSGQSAIGYNTTPACYWL